jgi:hypothetical protein
LENVLAASHHFRRDLLGTCAEESRSLVEQVRFEVT